MVFVGVNSLTLNPQAMCKLVQIGVNQSLGIAQNPLVVKVHQTRGGNFTITLAEPEKKGTTPCPEKSPRAS